MIVPEKASQSMKSHQQEQLFNVKAHLEAHLVYNPNDRDLSSKRESIFDRIVCWIPGCVILKMQYRRCQKTCFVISSLGFAIERKPLHFRRQMFFKFYLKMAFLLQPKRFIRFIQISEIAEAGSFQDSIKNVTICNQPSKIYFSHWNVLSG